MNRQMKRQTGEVWKAPEHRSFCPLWSWRASPPGMGTRSLTWQLSKPHTLGIFMEVSSRRHDRLLTDSPAPLPSLDEDGGAESSKLPIMVLVTSQILKLSPSPPRVTSLEQKMFPSPRKFQGIWKFCVQKWGSKINH